jgi:nucleotide-binding universal stress UspA family protein
MNATVGLELERAAENPPSFRLLDSPDPAARASRPRTVVCGVDGSETGREVIRVAAELSDCLDARLVLVHVAPIPAVPGTSVVPGAAEELMRADAERARGFLTGLLADVPAERRAERRVAFGRPAAALEAVARDESADLIVLGGRGRGALAGALFGSVSADVARSAPCPVVVVGPQARSEN